MSKILSGRTAIITGANQGLGAEIARQYILSGANVMLCARDAGLLNQVATDLSGLAAPDQQVAHHVCDVSVYAQVDALVNMVIAQFGELHILVNNAGVYGPKGDIENVDLQDWCEAIEINLYGSVLPCRAVLPHFKRQGYGKIIQLSGGGATNPLPRLSAYAASKAAVVRFAETLAEEVRGSGIDVNAVAPGALNTRMLDEVIAAGPEKVGAAFYSKSLEQKESGGSGLKPGADLAVFLASADSDGITGKLISAIWDLWRDWPGHLDELSTSDAYTLRRIVGRDRGFEWGDR